MSHRTLSLLQIDSFAERAFGGNPAVVLPEADGLAEEELARVAAELRAPGTAFLTPTDRPGADRRLRVFTPAREVRYSGHTTLAAAHALAETGAAQNDRLVLDTLAGPVAVELERREGRLVIWQAPPLPTSTPFDGDLAPLLDALGLAARDLAGWARPALTPERDLLLAVATLAALRALGPDMAAVAARATAAGLRGLCTVTRETIEPTSATHTRFFAPHVGIPEDIVTGSAHAAIGVWLVEAGGLEARGGTVRFTGEQGDGLGRPGRLAVEVALRNGRPAVVRVGGTAVTVLTGSLSLP